MDFWGEDVVGFEEAGEDEEGEHDAGGPGEHSQRERGGDRCMDARLGFAEDDASEQGDGGGDGDEEEGVEEMAGEDLRRLEDGVGGLYGEEERAEDDVEREHAEEEGSELGEFEEGALEDFAGWKPLGPGHGGVVGPCGLEAIPDGGGHGASGDADEKEREGGVGVGLLLDAGDDGFAVVAEELFEEAGGEALRCGEGLVEGTRW